MKLRDYIKVSWAAALSLSLSGCISSSGVPAPSAADAPFVTEYLTPVRVVCSWGDIDNADHLLEPFPGQVSTVDTVVTSFSKGGSVLLDFGREIQGGIEIVRNMSGSRKVRFRLVLGESVSEALSSVDARETTATNDHAMRDMEIYVPWLGSAEYGNSGFRFARLDLVDGDGTDVGLVAVRAVSKYRDVPYLGTFRCSDDRMNQIWQTGAYTVHLCMQ